MWSTAVLQPLPSKSKLKLYYDFSPCSQDVVSDIFNLQMLNKCSISKCTSTADDLHWHADNGDGLVKLQEGNNVRLTKTESPLTIFLRFQKSNRRITINDL